LAGQDERFTLLREALLAARPVPVVIDRADAVRWVERVARERALGTTTVVYHSIVWQYLGDDERDAIATSLHDAGDAATRDAPLAWLRLEPPAGTQSPVELRVTTWPEAMSACSLSRGSTVIQYGGSPDG
jgi:hypothetical protein